MREPAPHPMTHSAAIPDLLGLANRRAGELLQNAGRQNATSQIGINVPTRAHDTIDYSMIILYVGLSYVVQYVDTS